MPTLLDRTTPLAARVGARVLLLRKRAGWSQEQLAQKTGYARAAIASIETGRIVPALEKLLDLAQAFGVPASLLLEDGPLPGATLPLHLVPLSTWTGSDRRVFLRALQRLVAELEEADTPA